jgi:regulator of sigma E protease
MTILAFIGILVVLILVHELGHFLAAKLFNIRVDEFGLGFPPKLWGVKKGETEYTLNMLPIGGFVRIYGEDPADVPSTAPDIGRSMASKSHMVQAIVLCAGVAFNILFAWMVFTFGFMFGMPSALEESEIAQATSVKLLITEVVPGSPAANAGILAGDEILDITARSGAFDDITLTPSTIANFIGTHEGQTLTLALMRSGSELSVEVTPQTGVIADAPDRPAAGFVMTLAGIITLPVGQAIVESAHMTWNMLGAITSGLVDFFAKAFTLNADLQYVSGPIGIVGLVGDARALGIAYVVTFMAFISLNLAVINMLPFPALDGGRLAFVIYEAITRRRIPPLVAKSLNVAGFFILIGLMIAVTVSDVFKLL